MLILGCIASLLLAACTEPLTYDKDRINDPYANFDMLARVVGERYCFFRQKNIDWDSLCAEYRTRKPTTWNCSC